MMSKCIKELRNAARTNRSSLCSRGSASALAVEVPDVDRRRVAHVPELLAGAAAQDLALHREVPRELRLADLAPSPVPVQAWPKMCEGASTSAQRRTQGLCGTPYFSTYTESSSRLQ